MNIYGASTIGPTLFGAILSAAKSPVLAERKAQDYYSLIASYGIDPTFCLSIFAHESNYGTNAKAVVSRYNTRNWSNTRTRRKTTLGGKSVTTDRGNFWVYQNWYDSLDDLCYRLSDPTYAYAGKRTVETVVPIMAPPGDFDNDPLAYVRGVVAQMTAWQQQEKGGTVAGHVPKPPITNHIIGIPPKQDGVGVERIGTNRTPRATVLHSMAGTLGSCDNYFPGADVAALTDFGIGQTNHNDSGFAQIIQWCDIRGRLMPWASGPVRVPQGDGPRFLAHFGGPGAVNNVGVSIEHDDTTTANGSRVAPGEALVTVYQWSASIWLQAYLHAEEIGQTADTYDWNMHHREFCGDDYKTCPRPRITDHTEGYQAAVKAIMDHHQRGTPYPAGGLMVAGIRINTPPEGAGNSTGGIVAQYIDKPGPFLADGIDEKGEPYTVIKWGGKMKPGTVHTNAVDIGISGEGTDSAAYDRSLKANAFTQYNRQPKK